MVVLPWLISSADSHLDKYEASLMFNVSDQLYVSRGCVMRLKRDALG